VWFHLTLLALCAEMGVEPKLCLVARPEHEGKVERAIPICATAFSPGDGSLASTRTTVGDVLADERHRLLALPEPLGSGYRFRRARAVRLAGCWIEPPNAAP
jgi:hypothetical protein